MLRCSRVAFDIASGGGRSTDSWLSDEETLMASNADALMLEGGESEVSM